MADIPGRLAISSLLARIRSLWRGLRHREQVEAEMSDEFRHHLELRTEDLIREGLSPQEAARRARIEFGHVEAHKEDARASRGLRLFDQIGFSWLDFKLGLRMLVRHPGLTVVGGLAMAFGIAIGTGTFQFLKDAAFPTLPYAGGERVVQLQNLNTRTTRPDRRALHDFVTWRDELRSVEDLTAFYPIERNLSLGEELSAPVPGVAISATGFELVPVPPLLGRTLLPGDESPGATAVTVIGYDLWRERFGRDPEIVGRTVRLGEEQATVVGVMPEGFEFPLNQGFWVPFRLNPLDYEPGQGPGISVLGRLVPGASLEVAQAELSALGARAAARWPATHGHLTPEVERFPPSVAPSNVLTVSVLGLSALFLTGLMVVISANVGLLLFARAAAREGEIAIRNALGASRSRIVVQLLAEALVLAGVATLLGLLAGSLGLRWVLHVLELQEAGIPFWFRKSLSPITMGYAAVLALVGAAMTGVLPGLKVTSREAQTSLQRLAARGSGARMGRLWTVIIVIQVALTVLFGPVVFSLGQDTWQIITADQGLPAWEYLSARLEMDGTAGFRTRAEASETNLNARFQKAARELKRRLSAEPGVTGVTLASQLPGGWHDHQPVEVDAAGVPAPGVWGNRVQLAYVDLDFFDVVGAMIVAGRGFNGGDFGPGSRTVVVNESFVREFLGGRNAVGRRLRYPLPQGSGATGERDEEDRPWYEIIGVVRDLAMSIDPDLPHNAGIYHPLNVRRRPPESSSTCVCISLPSVGSGQGAIYPVQIAVHLAGQPGAFAGRLRELAAEVDRTLRIHRPQPLDQAARDTLLAYDSWFRVIVLAGLLALLLTNAGIYAIVSFTVSRRTREIGVRVALGADGRKIVWAVLSRTVRQVGLGAIIGVAVVLFLVATATEARLTLRAVGVLGACIAVMMGVCLLAAVGPTRRALAIEPTQALNADV